MEKPTYARERTLEKIVRAVEEIAERYPNLEPLSDEDLHKRRAKIEDTFRKLNEKR